MFRAGVIGLVLVAVAQGTPLSNDRKAMKPRQWGLGDPWTGWGTTIPPGTIPTGIPGLLPPITGGFTPPREKRDGPVLGGSEPSAEKAHIEALELEFEELVQQYGSSPPRSVSLRLKEIASELKQYGITIVQTPGGTSTTITPGKFKRQSLTIGDGGFGSPGFDLAALETTLETLIQQYGPNPPHDVYVVEENIKHILLAYGITIIRSPDGTTTTIYPSPKRAVAADFDIEKLEAILETLLPKYDGARPPLADWLVIQHIITVLKSYGITIEQSPDGTITIIKPSDKRENIISNRENINASAMENILTQLKGAYGTSPPRDILLIEQSIATILQEKNSYPISDGPIVPDPTIPGGPIVPDPSVPGGSITPSTKRAGTPTFTTAGLLEALQQLESQYGTYGSSTIPVPIFIVMQSIVTILQAEGVTVPGWPILIGPGSSTIGPSP